MIKYLKAKVLIAMITIALVPMSQTKDLDFYHAAEYVTQAVDALLAGKSAS